MDRRTRAFVGGLFVLLLFGFATRGEAFYVDERSTLSLAAKVQTRATIRLNDAEGWTRPDAKMGDLVQHRNLAIIEIDHDLKKLTKQLDILYPLKKLKIRAKYHLVGRFMYEGIYDYGPQIWQDVREQDKENIDSFKQAYDLWEFYFDFTRGPLVVRAGRQNLAWGETDLFRLLDGINPLDNTFGGPFEDLDDRRIPLWMLRASYNLGKVGPVSSLTLEGFWVPGFWDARVSPWAPEKTPYEVPLPQEYDDILYVNPPDKTGQNSRWGVRVQGVLGTNLNAAVAHYRTFLDLPTPHLVMVQDVPVLADLSLMQLHLDWEPVQITGASMNYWESHTNIVFRGEVAWFWEEPVFIQGINDLPLFSDTIRLPSAVLDRLPDLLGLDIRDFGLDGLPLNPQTGPIPKKDVLRYMIGFDKQIWIRPLNKTSMFFLSMQYFGQWISNYDERQRLPVPIYPNIVVFPKVRETEHVFTAIFTTNYRKGTLTPQLALAYDIRGAWLVQPSVNFIREPFRFMLQYSTIEGSFTNFGLFRDRDQISFILTYLLN